jgi:hypothetical protein
MGTDEKVGKKKVDKQEDAREPLPDARFTQRRLVEKLRKAVDNE